MDFDDFRSILRNSGVDIWTLINTAIDVSVKDYKDELRIRRDGIVERLYAPPPPPQPQQPALPPAIRHQDEEYEPQMKVAHQDEEYEPQMPVTQHQDEEYEPQMKVKTLNNKIKKNESSRSPATPQSFHNNNNNEEDEEEEEEEEDEGRIYGRRRRSSVEDEKIKIFDIKEQLEEPHQSEENLVQLLQELADMDITFKALKETDIGRHVNLLRKHPSEDVCRVVKQIVRKWKYLVDAWVKGGSSAQGNADGDSPQRNPPRNTQNGHHQAPDFGYSPSPTTHNGSSGSDKNEPESKQKVIARREPQTRPSQSPQLSSSAMLPNRLKEQKNTAIDPERLASARKRLQNNYQEAQNAKKQRTIQVMDLHDIPKPKNSFFSKNKGGSHPKHW